VATCLDTSAAASATSLISTWLRTKLIVQPTISSSDTSASSEYSASAMRLRRFSMTALRPLMSDSAKITPRSRCVRK